jgi:chromosome segregation ATPase
MTDPNDITQTSAVVDSAGGPGGIIGAVLGAMTVLGGLWRIVFGTRKERQDATERAAEIALRAAEHAEEHAERADEETASHKRALGTCEEQLAAMRAEIRARDEATAEAFRLMRADLDALRAENAKLRREQEVARGMLADLMRNASTPPSGLYVPDDVRAALAAQEDTGP